MSTASGTFSFMHSQGLCVAETNANAANGAAAKLKAANGAA